MPEQIETGGDRTKRLGFIHIPKTGGTSITEMLKCHGQIYYPKAWDYQSFTEILDDIRIVVGHVPYWHHALERLPRALFTVLREPVQRTVSLYKYILATPEHWAHRYLVSKKLTLAACYSHELLRVTMCDQQTRYLGWAPDHKLTLPCANERDQIDFATTNVTYAFSPIDGVTLQRAINLLRCEIDYAILEHPESITAMMARITGEANMTIPHSNAGGDVEYDVTVEELDLIRRNNPLDQELYDTAIAMLAEKGASSKP